MSTLYITEYSNTGFNNGIVNSAEEPEINSQTVSIGGTSAQSSVLKNNTQIVRLHTDSICSVLFGSNPTATTSKRRMAANQTEYFSVSPSSNLKIAVISNT